MSDEGALWTADPSLGVVPEVPEPPEPEKPLFDLDHTPEFNEPETEPEILDQAPAPTIPYIMPESVKWFVIKYGKI